MRAKGELNSAPILNPDSVSRACIDNPDQDTLIRAVEDARRVLESTSSGTA